MTKKPTTEIPAVPQLVDNPDTEQLVGAANKGDRYALAMLYARAAAALHADVLPGPLTRAWLASVAQDLHAVAWNAHRLATAGKPEPKEEALNKQMRAATRFARGRGRPSSRASATTERRLAGEVAHYLEWGLAESVEDAWAKVAAMNEQKGPAPAPSVDQVRAAWSRFGKEFGELRSVTPRK